ncbi:hypothetical protein jhhlp_005578 [Lomentospora prolificans]|uniref:IPT/TIG domain-containing protein n=1 Tax=Lomentospora prolificans TaxID=41688 RepID=A0A2N3N3G9_9PEZI|nr:hypothetical protein jhhlp_005578 [Lomentospora prolificans]
METFRFRGLDDEQTLDPSSLDFTKPLPNGNHDNFLDDPDAANSFIFHEPYQEESLSDSSSSKRASSEASSKTGPLDSSMMNDIAMDDGASHNAFSNDQLFETPNHQTFGTPPLEMDSTFDEDEFMNQSFDFARASSSPSDVPKPQLVANGRAAKPRSHLKSRSQNSFKISSREVSPHSTTFASNASSPNGQMDFHDARQMLMHQANGAPAWPHHLNPTAANHMPHAFAANTAAANQAMVLAQFPTFIPVPQGLDVLSNQPFLTFDREGMPPKTRVETQIHLKTVFPRLPPGVAKLHLPKHTVSKPKLWSKVPYVPSPDTLDLHTMLVCTSAMENEEMRMRALKKAREGPNSGFNDVRPEKEVDEDKPLNGGEVWICSNCIDRERKRSERKKVKKPDEEGIWKAEEWRRVVVFNTHEIREFPKPDPVTGYTTIELPMRIACYCRHQQEKVGFQVVFTIRDHLGRVLAQELTPSIMITDDHKNHLPPPGPLPSTTQISSRASQSSASTKSVGPAKPQLGADLQATPNSVAQPTPFRSSQSVTDLSRLQAGPPPAARRMPNSRPTATPRGSLSRPASPSNLSAPHAKKRKSSAGKLPVSMAMTPLDTATTASPPSQLSAAPSTATSPFAQGALSFPNQDSMFTGGSPSANGNLFGTAPSTPNMEDQSFFSPNASVSINADNLALRHRFSTATGSTHPSRASSPNSFNTALNAAALQSQFAQMLPNGATAASLAAMSSLGNNLLGTHPLPTITKVTPSEGSKLGGYEVTILGTGFHRALEVMFGDQKATATYFWADNILICIVPPSPVPGEVVVTFPQHQTGVQSMINPQKFKYLDDDEDKLLRSAMEVLARKMNGNLGDVKDFAMRVLNYRGLPPNAGASGGGSSGQGYNNASSGSSSTPYDVEAQLMKCLELIDLDDSPYKAQWDYKISSGHTMLHLACSLGFHRFAAGLVARGAKVDALDNGGFSPMHIAAMNNHPEIVRRLLLAGADPTLKSKQGLTPADVAESEDIISDLRRVARRTKRRSVGSLRSAASSSTSLRSLWGQDQSCPDLRSLGSATHIDYEDDSAEYSSFDSSGSDEEAAGQGDVDVDDDDVLQMRRSSIPATTRPHAHLSRTNTHVSHVSKQDDEEIAEVPASPNAAAAAFKQFQQAMTLYMQNLPQLPHIPQIPQMPQIPAFSGMGPQADNQASIYYAQFMRRITALVPGMSGQRPGTPDSDTAPPSYEDLYPSQDGDRKARSAEEARAMQPTDIKTADVEEETSTEGQEEAEDVADADKEPEVLKIGRKNAITKEQQLDILRAHEAKLKRLSSDRNLFMIWIPLLVSVLCALLYGRFPGIFSFVGNLILSLFKVTHPAQADAPSIATAGTERIVEVL